MKLRSFFVVTVFFFFFWVYEMRGKKAAPNFKSYSFSFRRLSCLISSKNMLKIVDLHIKFIVRIKFITITKYNNFNLCIVKKDLYILKNIFSLKNSRKIILKKYGRISKIYFSNRKTRFFVFQLSERRNVIFEKTL